MSEEKEEVEAIEAFEEAWFKLIEGVEEAVEKLLAQDSNKEKANREFEKTVEKLESDFMNILDKAQKTGVSSDEVDKKEGENE